MPAGTGPVLEDGNRMLPPRIRRAIQTVFILVFAGVGAIPACDSDIFDVAVPLSPEAFHLDFGAAGGTIPTVACDSEHVQSCGSNGVIAFQNGAGETTLQAGCDPGTARCFVQANTHVVYEVDVLQDNSFTSRVGRKAVKLARMLDIAYTVPANTATFDMPQIDIYVGPPGTLGRTDPGAVLVDSLPSLPRGATIGDASAGHLTIEDGSPARDLIESRICNKLPFVLVLSLVPRIDSGAPLPAGGADVVLRPLLGLGIR